MQVNRLSLKLYANPKKVIMRYWGFRDAKQLSGIVTKLESLSTDEVESAWLKLREQFAHRHRNFESRLLGHVENVENELGKKFSFPGMTRLLFGGYMTLEYTIEAAALFNPSIVPHPDQSDLAQGSTRFVLSLRAVGEGHISSVEFKIGIIDIDCNITLEEDPAWRTHAVATNQSEESYDVNFSEEISLDERVLFPQSADESNGMEDVRLVKFEDEGSTGYLGTYTAYNGHEIMSKSFETSDFKSFKIRSLKGSKIRGKGIALFPRKIRGKYAAVGRQDGTRLTMMYAGEDKIWDDTLPMLSPMELHEMTQIGNCGSPIETSEGWLMLTHGVGAMRRYTLGVALLDLEHPERVINYLKTPFMEPLEDEREGYVPNVLYTCGWMQHGDRILIPYAMSDSACGFATVEIAELLEELKRS
jgi:predicted GH43/DUF377 family glycosyl hydrolase